MGGGYCTFHPEHQNFDGQKHSTEKVYNAMGFYKKHVFVCENERDSSDPRGCCKDRGGVEFADELRKLCKEAGLKGTVRINRAGCLDKCALGAVAVIYPEDVWYGHLTREDAKEVFESHILNGKPVERLRVDRSAPKNE